ncbi:MAG: hypothetical protein HXX14_07305 [Bacteroidetes bacterium]|nr:hypothetical protein [Bacteroidota bacterium]
MKELSKLLRYILTLILLTFIAGLITCCNPSDKIDTNPALRLGFSNDTVLFDTVFTTLGSSTHVLKVYNRNSHRVQLSNIQLGGGAASAYRVNVDGQAGASFTNISIDAHDSLFIFVRVTINPNDQNAPFIVHDSLLFNLNGNRKKIDLVAWGQNAHYIIADTRLTGLPAFKIVAAKNQKVTWKADKPYIIYGYAFVDSAAQLSIDPGAHIYLHEGAGLWVFKNGSLKVNGTKDKRVIFQGDRLESFYNDVPGQWDRIWINESNTDSQISWAIIKNGFTGIQAETIDNVGSGKLLIENTEISNMTGYGILAKKYTINAGNLLVYGAGIQSLYLAAGGAYDFRHCTFSNYWDKSVRSTPSIRLSNYYSYVDAAGKVAQTKGDLTKAYFGNCLIAGNQANELFSDGDATAGTFSYLFDHSAIQTLAVNDAAHYLNAVRLQQQVFRMPKDTVIPEARGIGLKQIITGAPSPLKLQTDLFGNDRNLNAQPDAGAIQFQLKK